MASKVSQPLNTLQTPCKNCRPLSGIQNNRKEKDLERMEKSLKKKRERERETERREHVILSEHGIKVIQVVMAGINNEKL